MRNDALDQKKWVFSWSGDYSFIKNKSDAEFSYTEIRVGASYAYTLSQFYYFEGGQSTFNTKDSTLSYLYNYYKVNMKRIAAHSDLIYTSGLWGSVRAVFGLRGELGTCVAMKMIQYAYPQSSATLRFKTPLLINLQLLLGADFRLYQDLSFRTEFSGGFGQLYFLGGSNYRQKLMSLSTGLRYAW
jgi:hypothetical protein